jgi:hemerythrin-like domain-containing protein
VELFKRLETDHRLIDDVAGSLLAWWDEVETDNGDNGDLGGYLVFFSLYVCGAHHHTEEILFTTLADRAEVPPRKGPLSVLRNEHLLMSQQIEYLFEAAGAGDLGDPVRLSIRAFVSLVWEHVDKENSVLLPIAATRLQRHGVTALVPPKISEQEQTARQVAEALISRYQPVEDLDILRGDGCMACSAFADACHGIESEWWTSWEWAHYRSLDEG